MGRTPDPRHNGPYLRGAPSRRGLPRPAVIVGGAVAVVILGGTLLGERGLPSYLSLRRDRGELEARVAELREREQSLASDLEALEQDPEMVERVARERYRMHRPGERVMDVLGGPEDLPAAPPEIDDEESTGES